MTGNYCDSHRLDIVHTQDCPWHENWQGPTHECADGHAFRWQDFPPAVGSRGPLPDACPLWMFDGADVRVRCNQPVRELECDANCPTLQETRYA